MSNNSSQNNQPFSPSNENDDEDDEVGQDSELPEDFYSVEADEYEPPTRGRFHYVGRAAIALVFLLATIYLFGGLHEYLFFRETPEAVRAPEFTSQLAEAETLTVPIEVILLTGEERGSVRTEANVRDLLADADSIWDQAAIDFTLVGIQEIEVSDELIAEFLRTPRVVLDELDLVSEQMGGTVTVVLTRALSGINGIAYGGIDVVAVADYTTYFDFRVLAHEIGHIFSLSHVNDRGQLMYQGSRGMDIPEESARRAREHVLSRGFATSTNTSLEEVDSVD